MKRNRQGLTGMASLKIDRSKAYDRVEWNFLKNMMLRLGFAQKWVDLVMLFVTTVQYSVRQNDMDIGPIFPNRGLQ